MGTHTHMGCFSRLLPLPNFPDFVYFSESSGNYVLYFNQSFCYSQWETQAIVGFVHLGQSSKPFLSIPIKCLLDILIQF